jgi:hypothetical protein
MNSEVWGHANGRRTAGIIDGKLVFLCHASPHAPVFEIIYLLLGVHALGDNVTWPTERHSRERSQRPRLQFIWR